MDVMNQGTLRYLVEMSHENLNRVVKIVNTYEDRRLKGAKYVDKYGNATSPRERIKMIVVKSFREEDKTVEPIPTVPKTEV